MNSPADAQPQPVSELPSIARAASVIALGNIASRALGLVRETLKAHLFGASGQVDALNIALILPMQIYELVTGGIVNSALVPVFSEYSAPERRAELWQLASAVLTLLAILLALPLAALELLAPLLARIVGGGMDAPTLALTASLLRLTLPAVLFLSLSGVLSGLLYSLKRFTAPAFTASVFNAGMVVCALVFSQRWGVAAMAAGLLAGAVLQMLIQLPALRDALPHLRPALQLAHPGLRRIANLYLPIIFSQLVAQASIYIGLNLASRTGAGGIAWMGYATYIYQFPIGLVSTALSFAILPTLSRQAADGEFKATLVQGLNLVVMLILPATVGLFVLAQPIVALLYERGQFTPADTLQTARVLQLFLIGLSFAGVDQMLIFAFYARKDTLTPSAVGVASVGVYLVTALVLIRPLGLYSLMIADALKQMSHALITGWLLSRRIGGFGGTSLAPTLIKCAAASILIGLLAGAAVMLFESASLPPSFYVRALYVVAPASLAVAAYALLLARLRVPEFQLLTASVTRRLRSNSNSNSHV